MTSSETKFSMFQLWIFVCGGRHFTPSLQCNNLSDTFIQSNMNLTFERWISWFAGNCSTTELYLFLNIPGECEVQYGTGGVVQETNPDLWVNFCPIINSACDVRNKVIWYSVWCLHTHECPEMYLLLYIYIYKINFNLLILITSAVTFNEKDWVDLPPRSAKMWWTTVREVWFIPVHWSYNIYKQTWKLMFLICLHFISYTGFGYTRGNTSHY